MGRKLSAAARDQLPDRVLAVVTHDGLDIAELEIARDEDGLHEELVAALGVGWGVLLHRLEEDCRRRFVSVGGQHLDAIRNGGEHAPETSTS